MEEEKLVNGCPTWVQDTWEIIACHFNPKTKKWKCLSASDATNPFDKPEFKPRYEILEAEGHKLSEAGLKENCRKFETIGFNPSRGKVSWITFGEGSKERIMEILFDELRHLEKTGKTKWETK
jgi:hypothetical protein